MSYNQSILVEVERHILLHHKQILGYYRANTYKKRPKALLKWNKLIDLYWKSSGMWKIGDRE